MVNNLDSVWRINLCPPEQLPLWKWAELNIVLSTRQASAFPGPYRTSITPYVRGIFDALQDPLVRSVTVEKGAQTGLTLSAYVWACYCIVEDPGPILFVYPSADNARSASETRVMPMIEDSPKLREQIPDDPDEWTKLQYRMKKCTVNWVGSNSPANLASRPVRYLILDEVDKYPADNQTEGSAVSLAIQRTKTFWNRKILIVSTPTVPEGNVHAAYIDGDQRRYFIPCPHCSGMQFLKWAQVKFDSKVSFDEAGRSAIYKCEFCDNPITDTQKIKALYSGEWRPTSKAKVEGEVSFHISSLYAPWSKWSELVQKFLSSKDYPAQLQGFINSELGEPFLHFDNRIKDSIFAELEGDYAEGELWADRQVYAPHYQEIERAVFAGCDVQKGYLMAVFRQFVRGGDSGLIWSGSVANFDAMEVLADQFKAQYIIVDQRYRTREVQEWCFAHQGYIPSMGVTRRAKSLFTVQTLDLDEGKSRGAGRKIETVDYDGDMLKDILAMQIQRGEGSRKWLVPKGYAMNASYTGQMTAERLVNGRWINPQAKANHFWDAECLALLAAIRFGFWGQTQT